MPRWFPRADGRPGVNITLLAGLVGALLVAALYVYDAAYRVLHHSRYEQYEMILFVGWAVRALVAFICAWRFAIGKGLVWGLILLLLLLPPVLGDFVFGTAKANVATIVMRVMAGVALIAGIRGAWLARTMPPPPPDYAKVFE